MYQKIVTVNISLATSGVSRASFGTPLFASDHFFFAERSRTYIDIDSVAADVPTDSDAYKAALSAFSQDIPPAQIKLGRREADDVTLTPDAVTAVGQTYAVTVVGTDDVAITATFTTATGSETAADITADLAADLAGIVGVTVVDNTGTLTLSKSGVDDFSINTLERLSHFYTTTETAADMLAAISAENDDYYFVACNDHTDAFVMAMAEEVEARTKIYFVSLQDVTNLAAYSLTATDTMSKLKQQGYARTSAWYHDTADTDFHEMEYISIAAPADPGKKVWGDNRVFHAAAKNISTGNPLSVTEKGNLTDKSANFTEVEGGINISRQGQVSSGNWIDEIRDRDFLESETRAALQNLLINTPKLPYTDSGINRVRSVLSATYSRYVSTETQPNILQETDAFIINLPRRKDVAFADITARTLDGTVTLYLSGAILVININGNATYQAADA